MFDPGVTKRAVLATGIWLLAATPLPAAAYIGPGAGLGVIGTVVAVIGALVLLVVGFVWYPIKRIFRRGTPAKTTPDDPAPDPE